MVAELKSNRVNGHQCQKSDSAYTLRYIISCTIKPNDTQESVHRRIPDPVHYFNPRWTKKVDQKPTQIYFGIKVNTYVYIYLTRKRLTQTLFHLLMKHKYLIRSVCEYIKSVKEVCDVSLW